MNEKQDTPAGAAGVKHDTGKVRPSLVLTDMARAINAVIEVAEYGARKYAPGNWLLVPDKETRYREALMRHLLPMPPGERDAESGLRHAAHAAWNALATLELELRAEEALKAKASQPCTGEAFWRRFDAMPIAPIAPIAPVPGVPWSPRTWNVSEEGGVELARQTLAQKLAAKPAPVDWPAVGRAFEQAFKAGLDDAPGKRELHLTAVRGELIVTVKDRHGRTHTWSVVPGVARFRGSQIAAEVLTLERAHEEIRRKDPSAAFRRGWDDALRRTTAERQLVIQDFGGHLRIHATDRYGGGYQHRMASSLFDHAYAEGYDFAHAVLKQESNTQRRRQQEDARKRREALRQAADAEKAELIAAVDTCDRLSLALRRNLRVQIERGRLRPKSESAAGTLSLVWKRKRGEPVTFTTKAYAAYRATLWQLFRVMAEQARHYDNYREPCTPKDEPSPPTQEDVDRVAMYRALGEAVPVWGQRDRCAEIAAKADARIAALEAEKAERERQEPVAWAWDDALGCMHVHCGSRRPVWETKLRPLYARPLPIPSLGGSVTIVIDGVKRAVEGEG